MEANQILKSDILDIIFEGKNKAYGAYDLRSRSILSGADGTA